MEATATTIPRLRPEIGKPVRRRRASASAARVSACLAAISLRSSRARGESSSSLRLGEEGVEPAAVLHAAQRVGGDAQPHGALQRVAHQRHALQVGQEAAARLVVRVAHIVAREHALAGQLAAARHDKTSFFERVGSNDACPREGHGSDGRPDLFPEALSYSDAACPGQGNLRAFPRASNRIEHAGHRATDVAQWRTRKPEFPIPS